VLGANTRHASGRDIKKSDTTWFFKFAGEDVLVGPEAGVLEFLKGISFEAVPLPAGHPPKA